MLAIVCPAYAMAQKRPNIMVNFCGVIFFNSCGKFKKIGYCTNMKNPEIVNKMYETTGIALAKANARAKLETMQIPTINKVGFRGPPLFPMAIPANVPTMAPLEINKFVTEPFNNVYWSKMFLKLTNDNTYKVKNDANARPKRQMKPSLKACLYLVLL